MNALLQITYEVIAPIFVLIGLAYLVQKRVGFDLRTLTRLNFWVFVPAFLFTRIYGSTLSGDQLLRIFTHFVLLFATQFILTWFLAPLFGAGDRLRRALTASVLFYNSGNYGVPAAKLAFPSGIGAELQAIIIMFQNISNFTVGLALHAGGREGGDWKKTMKAIFHLPMIYTLLAAWIWRLSGFPLPGPLSHALEWLADGLVPIALITLGAQMASLESHRFGLPLAAALFLRLCLGPLLGFGIAMLLGFKGELAQALVVSTSFPTAINSALLAMEYDNEPDFAAAVVFYSTLFSAVTVSVVIYAVKHFGF